MKPDDVNAAGGPAFPVSLPGLGDNGWQGMTLRDWFAGEAASGLVSNLNPDAFKTIEEAAGVVANAAYAFADALIKERSK